MDVYFLCNPESPHLLCWHELCDRAGLQPHVVAGPTRGSGSVSFRSVLGAVRRVRREVPRAGAVLHVHSGGMIGLVAWLSRRPYLLTPYGSEYLRVSPRSLQGRMSAAIARRAVVVTTCSIELEHALVSAFGVKVERVMRLNPGVDIPEPATNGWRSLLPELSGVGDDDDVLVTVRRPTPFYRISQVIDAFVALPPATRAKWLVVPRAFTAADDPFWVELRARHRDDAGVVFIDRDLETSSWRSLLDRADVAVSLATTDLMSMSVMESLVQGCVVVLNALPTYQDVLNTCPSVVWVEHPDQINEVAAGLEEAIARTADAAAVSSGQDFARRLFDPDDAVHLLFDAYGRR